MKKVMFVTTMLLLSIATFSQQLPADKIIGIWESMDNDPVLKFEFFESDGKYFGKLLYASNMFEADGKTPKKDDKNPDDKLKTRSRKGIVNVTGLTYDDGEYTDGELYIPTNGRTYSLDVKLTSLNEMEFRGYIGFSLFGSTIKFQRIE